MTDTPIPREAGRRSFGLDPAAYDRARPPYPPQLYETLATAQPIEGARVLDVGAGTGLATFELLRRGATHVAALEPDERLAAFLRTRAEGLAAPVTVIESALEDARLDDEGFDLVVSATAFHWIEERHGLSIVHRALATGGHVALWWVIFADPGRPDPFHDVTAERLSFAHGTSPSAGAHPDTPHGLEVEARVAALTAAGFVDVGHHRWPSSLRYDARRLRDLYSTFSPYQQLPPAERDAHLDYVEAVANERFGGIVERPLMVALYLGRKP